MPAKDKCNYLVYSDINTKQYFIYKTDRNEILNIKFSLKRIANTLLRIRSAGIISTRTRTLFIVFKISGVRKRRTSFSSSSSRCRREAPLVVREIARETAQRQHTDAIFSIMKYEWRFIMIKKEKKTEKKPPNLFGFLKLLL